MIVCIEDNINHAFQGLNTIPEALRQAIISVVVSAESPTPPAR
jgi:hypothetical protein